MTANFLTGPVAVRPEVRAAFEMPALSHRGAEFLRLLTSTRERLATLVDASQAALLVGSGTLANDTVAAQLAHLPGPGLVLSNGEFGQRLVDHARRWRLDCTVSHSPWGLPFNWDRLHALVDRCRPRWVWAVLAETSTGVLNPLDELQKLSQRAGADLCLDAISAIGLIPVKLSGVRFATAVSGKGLAAFPGIAAVFHDGRLAQNARVPRYLDLAEYSAADGVPYTHSSNLVGALECSLRVTDWRRKFETVRRRSWRLREALRHQLLPALARDEHAAPGIITVEIPAHANASDVATALQDDGIAVAHQSNYLRQRNWLQIALMGEIELEALRNLPGALRVQVSRAAEEGLDASAHRRRRDRWRSLSQ